VSGIVRCWGLNIHENVAYVLDRPFSTQASQRRSQYQPTQTIPAQFWTTGQCGCWVTTAVVSSEMAPTPTRRIRARIRDQQCRFGERCRGSLLRALGERTDQCWGYNNHGQLGNDSTIDSPLPVNVVGISTAIAISAGVPAPVQSRTGAVECWGNNDSGQLGNGLTVDAHVPVLVSGVMGAVGLTAANFPNVLFWQPDWSSAGLRARRRTRDGNGDWSATPVTVSGISTAVAVSGSDLSVCALVLGGGIKCWGDTSGTGNQVDLKLVPVASADVPAMRSIATGWEHSCGVATDTMVKCWVGMPGMNSLMEPRRIRRPR